MTRARFARWAIAFAVVLFYAGGTYALTASGSPGLPDASNLACGPTNAIRLAPDALPTLTLTSSTTSLPSTSTMTTDPTTTTTTTTSTTTTSTVTQPSTTTTTTTTTSTTTQLQPTTTTTTETETKTATAAPVTTTSTDFLTETAAPVTTTTTATTTSPVTTTDTTTVPVTETQDLVRTVTATATCTATTTRPSRPTIVRFRLLHGTVLAGQPVVALVYAYPAGAKVTVTISRGGRKVATARFVVRHEPTKLTIPASKVKTPGGYMLTVVVSSGRGRSTAAQLHLRVLASLAHRR